MSYKQYLPAAAFFAAVSVVFFFPVFTSFGNWGLYDWDQHLFYHASPRIGILDYGQFPLWNAHYCGGNPLLANPQSAFLSPFFLLVLLFGAVAGLKLQAILYMFFGLFGTFLLAKKLGITPIPSALAAVAFMLSSWYAVRVVVGHTTFFPFALMPWTLFFYLKSLQSRKWLVAAAITLASMFLAGGVYPFYASVLLLGVYSLLSSISSRNLKPILVVAAVFALTMLLAAVKVLPVIDFTTGVPVEKDVQLTSAGIVARALLLPSQNIVKNDAATGRSLTPESREKEVATLSGLVPWQWHEYSAYIGIITLLLAVLSLINYKRNWNLLLLALFFFLLSLGNSSPIPLWQLLRNLPFLSSLHGPSRFIIPFVFITALLAARTLTTMSVPRKKIVSIALLVAVTIELLFVSLPLVSTAFPLTPLKNLQTANPDFIQFYASEPYSSQYPNLLQNLGTLNCYERLHLVTRAVPQFVDGIPYSGFIGNAYIAETNKSLNLSYFSPNKVRVDLAEAQINRTSTVVINQNYYKGWKASNGRVESHNGLLAAEVTSADREIGFRYAPKSFTIGAIISAVTSLLLLLIFLKLKLIRKILFQPQS